MAAAGFLIAASGSVVMALVGVDSLALVLLAAALLGAGLVVVMTLVTAKPSAALSVSVPACPAGTPSSRLPAPPSPRA
ncbi:hypothetical protein ACQP1O_29475 [Nocardia sp. CA-151230]|uniref:hypothetical protein n=1 Tax=Nocardia sp. CA-151230 TaxID=3239982 RepID=UPI003D91E770